MNVFEEYEFEIENEKILIKVTYDSTKEFPYYAFSSYKTDGAGKSSEEAKLKCENATRMEIKLNK